MSDKKILTENDDNTRIILNNSLNPNGGTIATDDAQQEIQVNNLEIESDKSLLVRITTKDWNIKEDNVLRYHFPKSLQQYGENTFLWMIENFSKILTAVHSGQISWKSYNIQLTTIFSRSENGNQAKLFFELQKSECGEFPFCERVECTIMNRVDHRQNKSQLLAAVFDPFYFGEPQGKRNPGKLFNMDLIVDKMKDEGFVGNDDIVFVKLTFNEKLKNTGSTPKRINQLNGIEATNSQNLLDADLRRQLYENTTYDGHMIWKIDNFAKRFEQAVIGKTTALHSAPSFTDKYGYKFCARLYLNGDGMGKGTHVSLFFVLMKSEFDNLLPWPFSKTVTFTLLNQDNSEKNVKESFNADVKSSSFKRPIKHMNIAFGCRFFVTQEKLKEPGNGFIKDGCFYLDIKVK